MKTKIIKTSLEHRKELDEQKLENICPECGNTVCNFGSYHYKIVGLKFKKITTISCSKCGCEWQIEKDI